MHVSAIPFPGTSITSHGLIIRKAGFLIISLSVIIEKGWFLIIRASVIAGFCLLPIITAADNMRNR